MSDNSLVNADFKTIFFLYTFAKYKTDNKYCRLINPFNCILTQLTDKTGKMSNIELQPTSFFIIQITIKTNKQRKTEGQIDKAH